MKSRFKIREKVSYYLDADFRANWFFEGITDDYPWRNLAIIKFYFVREEGGDEISLSDYVHDGHMNFLQIKRLVLAEIPKLNLSYMECSSRVDIYNLRTISEEDTLKFKKFLEKRKRELVGMKEDTIIVCNKEVTIQVSDISGYVPSVSIPEISYPDAVFRDGDLCDILVDSGKPVISYGQTSGNPGYPSSFRTLKRVSKEIEGDILFALEYDKKVCKVKERRGGVIL